ncbi:hypothetical protein LTR08_002530 [Meristemomyces frigidus]|nr:hypothetical protein LTR08_002530 [Meristemomyces frigidus]
MEHKVAQMLAQQKQTLNAAKGREGQRPNAGPSRLELERELSAVFYNTRQQASGYALRQHFINHAYPPSTKVVGELKQIVISDLRLETHHTGKVLFVRTFGQPVRISGVSTAVEDANGDVARLAVYNSDPLLGAEHVVPMHAVFAIKEPYFKTNGDGGTSLRVDHLSDLVRLQPHDPIIPVNLCSRLVELQKSAVDWKMEGNASYATGDFFAAVNAYTQGLASHSDIPETLKCNLLRNRSICNLHLKRYEPAMEDAERSAVSTSSLAEGMAATLNAKAHYRAGLAAYELAQYEKARGHYESMQALTPRDGDAACELSRTAKREIELASGVYDFVKMSKSVSKKHNRLDHASFVSRVAVKSTPKHGRGAFAITDIKAGELVLCEKAFGVAFGSDEGKQTYMIVNLNTNRGSVGTQATLLFQLVQKMLHNPLQAARFLDLYDGGYSPKSTARVVDGLATIDTFHTQAIVEVNAFACSGVSSTNKGSQQKAAEEAARDVSTGVWITASYINHACNGNAMRSFIGDMMIVRATKDIPAGAEILMPYISVDPDVAEMQKKLQKSWAFKCDCVICSAEEKSEPSQRKARAALVQEINQFLRPHKPTAQYRPREAIVNTAEQIYARLEQTYDPKLFQNLPRIALAHLGFWLCHARISGPETVTITSAMRVLRSLGYSVVVSGGSVQFDHTHCHLLDLAIDAAMYAAQAYLAKGEAGIGNQFEGFAMGLYRTMFGEMGGFKERYGGG